MQKNQASTLGKWTATILFVAVLVSNYLVSAFRINGTTTGEVSDAYPNLFAPIGLTFAIWGVIYLLLAVYCVRQFGVWGAKGNGANQVIKKITPLFIANSLINTAWVFAWQYKIIWLSLILIICLLLTLIFISLAMDSQKLTGKDYWTIKLPFSVYFGWVTVATIANTVIWLVSIGWDGIGLSQQFWTVSIMAIGAVIGVTAALRFRSVAYILVFAWAYLGILLKHVSVDYFAGIYPQVVTVSVLLIAAFVFTAIFINGKLSKTKML